MRTTEDAMPGSLHPLVSRLSVREAVIKAARKHDPEIGDEAMIASMEWGYWIGSIYVSKADVAKSANDRTERPEAEQL